MIAFERVFQTPLLQVVGWALLQFLWQGALVALGTAAALALLRGRAASTRYLVACAALALMLILPVITVLRGAGDRPLSTWSSGLTSAEPERIAPKAGAGPQVFPATLADVSKEMARSSRLRWQEVARPFLPQIAMIWFVGVLFLSMRLARSWNQLRHIARHGTAPAPARWQIMVSELMKRMQIRRSVRLLSSTLNQVPAAFGWLRPVILVPMSALNNLSVQQMESILAHELAHIRRHDYLVNLLQSAVEILLFYHPAVWWVSARMRVERENCCDDIAVEICGDVKTYARALVELEELRRAPALVVAANGGSLLVRIRRLLQNSSREPADRSPAGAMLVVLTLLFVSFIALAARAQDPAVASEQPLAESGEAAPAPKEPAAAAQRVTEEEVRQITDEVLRVAATCTDRETLRRCADYHAKEVELQCWPSNRGLRSWLWFVGKDQRRKDEGDPTRIIQNQIAELNRQKMGGNEVRLSDFPECRDPR
jgi:beta-lactamase regulating signal transducer with metallopeptidase domain